MGELEARKLVKQIGTSIGLILNKEESSIYDIKKGDLVHVKITKIEEGELGEC